MTTDRMPPASRAVTQPWLRPWQAGDLGRRAARVRPYCRHHEHRPHPHRQPRQDEQRAVLDRVLAGLHALPPQPAAQSSAPRPTSPSSAGTNTTTSISVPAGADGRVTGGVSPVPDDPFARSRLGCQLMPLVRAVLARRPEAAVPAARVEPSPDAIRTQPLNLVGVGS